MLLYEYVLITRNDVTLQQGESAAYGIASKPGAEEGATKKRKYRGQCALAYRIKKKRKGHHMLVGWMRSPSSSPSWIASSA